MYKCQLCGTQVPPGNPQKKRITRTRPQTYSQEWVRVRNTEANKLRTWRELPRSRSGGRHKGKPRFIEVLIPKHTGWEIAEERAACRNCFSLVQPPLSTSTASLTLHSA